MILSRRTVCLRSRIENINFVLDLASRRRYAAYELLRFFFINTFFSAPFSRTHFENNKSTDKNQNYFIVTSFQFDAWNWMNERMNEWNSILWAFCWMQCHCSHCWWCSSSYIFEELFGEIVCHVVVSYKSIEMFTIVNKLDATIYKYIFKRESQHTWNLWEKC